MCNIRTRNMFALTGLLSCAAAWLFHAPVVVARGGEQCLRASLVEQSLASDQTRSAAAVQALRAQGQAGLDALCAEHDRLVKAGATPIQLERIRTIIDAVARQRDAHASRLYWHTDLAEALDAAQAAHRPVLSLRLLGNLDEDLSCANSRFFRSVLYANAEVSGYLRDHYILHWQSLRPVPRMTIDMGDGRQIKRTITGNSIHYVLDPRGELIDAIPGLQSPTMFLKTFRQAGQFALQLDQFTDAAQRGSALRRYHQSAIEQTDLAWRANIARLNASPGQSEISQTRAPVMSALAAAPIAETKMRAEVPVFNAMLANTASPPAELSENDAQTWERIAALHLADARLDDATVALMREKAGVGGARDAGRLSRSKGMVEDPFVKMLRTFQRSLAADTVRNEYVIHRRIHEWLAIEPAGANVDTFNQRVYAQLFLSPLDDPWLGLAPAEVYAALDQNGLTSSCQ